MGGHKQIRDLEWENTTRPVSGVCGSGVLEAQQHKKVRERGCQTWETGAGAGNNGDGSGWERWTVGMEIQDTCSMTGQEKAGVGHR